MALIYLNFVELEIPMFYAKIQYYRTFGSGKVDF